MKKVGVALIGAGVGLRTHLPSLSATGAFDILGICSSSPERTKAAAAASGISRPYSTVEELCADKDVELVVIASPPMFHEYHYGLAVSAGKDIILEKPVALDSSVVRTLSEIKGASSQLTVVNHQLRFLPEFRHLASVLRDDLLGRVYRVRIFQQGNAFVDPATPWFWSLDSKRGGGIRWAMGTHIVDLWKFLFPTESIARVYGFLDAVMLERQGQACDASSCMVSHLLTERGCAVELTTSAFGFGVPEFEVSVCGELGEARFDLVEGLRFSSLATKGRWVPWDEGRSISSESAAAGSFFRAASRYMAQDLALRYIQPETSDFDSVASSMQDAVAVHELLDLVLSSATTRSEKVIGLSPKCNSVI